MRRRRPIDPRAERGYALLLILLFVALLIIGASVATLNSLTEGRRELETEMIWRGEQYERAIGLYYRKYGRFPTSLDDLIKEQPAIRFLREEYPDPMNKADGSWRFIYVTGAGQLIGSVRYTSLQQMLIADEARQMGIPANQVPGAPSNGLNGGSGGVPGLPSGLSGSGTLPGGAAAAPPGQQSGQLNGQSTPPGVTPAPPQPSFFGGLQSTPGGSPQISESSGPVIGGFIVGVASKINEPSLKVYKGGTTYKQWEFIYNPLEQTQSIGGLSVAPTTNPNGQPAAPVPPPAPQLQSPH